ncbi:MAG: helix-turn-helix transcriptional regulator [Vitreoscilla sp.]|nr:helix-turn-helix transcriptional regulator [Vitreoscilla sp.]
MAKKTAALLPATDALVRQFGERLRLARLRRRLLAKQVAERAGMSPMTLRSLERGGSGVTLGAYLAVMQVLGIERDLDLLGKTDPVGRELQDAQLPAPTQTKRPSVLTSAQRSATTKGEASNREVGKQRKPSEVARDWIKKSDFASSDALAGLITPLPSLKSPLTKKGR